MSESSKTWIPIKKEFDKMGWYYTRIENNVGIPDLIVYVPEQRRDVWIELKYCQNPGTGGNIEIGLRKEQFIMMRQMFESGRSVILLARVGDLWCIWTDVESWEMAKKMQSWDGMKEKSLEFCHPRRIVERLQNCHFGK